MALLRFARGVTVGLPLLLAVLIGCILPGAPVGVLAKDEALPVPTWGRYCEAPFEACSTIEVYQNWNEKKNRLSFTVDALSKDPNAKDVLTVWMVMDAPDLYVAKNLYREGIDVVIVHPRGSKQTPSFVSCARTPSPYDKHCWMSEACAAELAVMAANTGNNSLIMAHFSPEQVAHDLHWALGTLGDGRTNVVLGQGLSSAVVLRLLQDHHDTKAAVMLLDYVNPLKFDMYKYLGGTGMDVALQHLLTLCDDDVVCVGRLGATEGSWRRLLSLLTMAKEGKLSCASRLRWGSSEKGDATVFSDRLRAVLALMLRYPAYPFLASNADLLSLIPSFLYRLQRCNDKDVAALNRFFEYLERGKSFQCPESALQMNWLVNYFTWESPPNNIDVFYQKAAADHFLLPALSSLSSFHAAAVKFPRVLRNATSEVLSVNAAQKIFVLIADTDALLPQGAASQVALSFDRLKDSVKVLQLRGIMNRPLALLAPCLINNLKMFKAHGTWADQVDCTLDASHQIDFISGATDLYYGTVDAWDFDKPNDDDAGDDHGGENRAGKSRLRVVLKYFFCIFGVLLVLGGVGYFIFRRYVSGGPFSYGRFSDNFYENLHQ